MIQEMQLPAGAKLVEERADEDAGSKAQETECNVKRAQQRRGKYINNKAKKKGNVPICVLCCIACFRAMFFSRQILNDRNLFIIRRRKYRVCSFVDFSQSLSINQQCFSLTTNQHQSNLSAQKPTSEQVDINEGH